MAGRWSGLIFNLFHSAVSVQVAARLLQVASFHATFFSSLPLPAKLLCAIPACYVPMNRHFSGQDVLGRWIELIFYSLFWGALQQRLFSPFEVSIIAFCAYVIVPARLTAAWALLSRESLYHAEIKRHQWTYQLPFLAWGCLVFYFSHLLGIRDIVFELIVALVFAIGLAFYLERLQQHLPEAQFTQHILAIAYYLLPALIAILFSFYDRI